MSTAIYEHVRDLAKTLSAQERLRLIADLAIGLSDRATVKSPKTLFKSVRGILKGHGPSPSPEDFEEARRAMSGHLAPVEAP